jgi:hypothetical protein
MGNNYEEGHHLGTGLLKDAIWGGLNKNPTPQNIKDILGAHSIYKYYCLIAFFEKEKGPLPNHI